VSDNKEMMVLFYSKQTDITVQVVSKQVYLLLEVINPQAF
jgi:hypothetical protein